MLLRLSEAEHVELVGRAKAAGVSVPRFVMEAALAVNRVPAPERIAVAEELLAQSRMLGRAGNNLNQLAAWANSHRGFPARAHRVLEELRVAIVRLQEVARRVEDVYQP